MERIPEAVAGNWPSSRHWVGMNRKWFCLLRNLNSFDTADFIEERPKVDNFVEQIY